MLDLLLKLYDQKNVLEKVSKTNWSWIKLNFYTESQNIRKHILSQVTFNHLTKSKQIQQILNQDKFRRKNRRTHRQKRRFGEPPQYAQKNVTEKKNRKIDLLFIDNKAYL